jgi:phage baseplate assembly protein W
MTAPNGPHLSFPFHFAANGCTAQVQTLQEHVRDELIQLILTNFGERADLPDFGGGVRRLVFEGAGLTTSAMAKAMLSQALSRWLVERVTVEDLNVTGVNEKLTVDLVYRVAGTSDQRLIRFQRSGG